MRARKRKIILSRWLLAVFLPALLLSSFHIHEGAAASEPDCVECAAHVPHVAHLYASAGVTFDCEFCHFLSLPYLLPFAVLTLFHPDLRQKVRVGDTGHVSRCAHVVVTLRAPPV